jgi:hypothetical protein
VKQKIKEWIIRYLPAEIVGTITALAAAGIIHSLYNNPVLCAYAGTLGEAIGFYGALFIQNLVINSRKLKTENKPFLWRHVRQIVLDIVLELGVAALFDELLLRPFFMFLFPILLKNFTLGIFMGKIAGDICFYMLAILCYEHSKRRGANK